MDIQIRLATLTDIDEIASLQASALKDASPSYDSQQLDALISSQTSNRSPAIETTLVATYQDQIIGVISSILERGQISGLYVLPAFMNQGIGSRLVHDMEAKMIAEGIRKAQIMSSLDASPFYQKQGYTFKRSTGFYASGFIWIPCTYLEKTLIFTPSLSWSQAWQRFFRRLIKFLISELVITMGVLMLLSCLILLVSALVT